MDSLNAEYWNSRYINNNTPWDIGYPSPAIIDYFEKIEDKSVRILVPGAGNAYEVEALHSMGFDNVFVIDLSEKVIRDFKRRNPQFPDNQLICNDYFNLNEKFDYIIEQTFFCALNPTLRSQYVQKSHQLLNASGKLIGVMFNKMFVGGPPFGGSEQEYRTLFESNFTIIKMELCRNSIQPRQGSELFILVEKR